MNWSQYNLLISIQDPEKREYCELETVNEGKAHDVEIRPWLEDTLRRLPTEKDITALLPENWQPVTAK